MPAVFQVVDKRGDQASPVGENRLNHQAGRKLLDRWPITLEQYLR